MSRRGLCAAVSVVLAISMGAGEPSQDGLVVLGPKGPLEAQLRYLMNSWPSQFAIAVVKAAKAPNCDTPEKGPAVLGNTTYCWLEVRPSIGSW